MSKSSPFTADNTALLLIDHQVGTMQLIRNEDAANAKAFTLALAKAAKILGLPVVLTSSQEGNAQDPIMPELAALLPDEHEARIQRAGIVNAWTDDNFRNAVKATGRPNLAMAGVTTDVCLVFPAIDAVREGFGVQAIMDASGSPYEFSERASQQRMRDAGVVLTATNTLIAELAQDWSSDKGGQLIQLLFSDVLPAIERPAA